MTRRRERIWLFDLDNTLHNASFASFVGINQGMNDYIVQELGIDHDAAAALRHAYWLRYGATLLGLVRHHAVDAAHFLHHTHLLPGLEASLRGNAHDVAALKSLRGRKFILTNAPRAYALRVLGGLGIEALFDRVFCIEDMRMFGQLRPKPDARMLRRLAARLRVQPSRCVLVEDTLTHQRSARRIGMKTVWMQRWARAAPHGVGGRWQVKPMYVDLKLRCLRMLHRRPI